MSEQACRSKMSSLIFLHGIFLFSSLPLFSPQICMESKKGRSHISHNCGSGELVQPSFVFFILILGNLLGDKGFEARQTGNRLAHTEAVGAVVVVGGGWDGGVKGGRGRDGGVEGVLRNICNRIEGSGIK